MNSNPRYVELNTKRQARVDELVAKVSAVNRPGLAAHVEEYRFRCKANSALCFVSSVLWADAKLNQDFRSITVHAARILVAAIRTEYAPGSGRIRLVLIRQHIRWLFGVKRLDERDSPCSEGRLIERALNLPRPKLRVVGQVISPQNQDRLVQSIPSRASLSPPFPLEVRDRWVLRGLKGTGHRVSEFVSIKLRGVRFEVHHDATGRPVRVARIAMDETAPDLKTGERALYVREGVEELEAWLRVHPGVRAPADQDWLTFDGERDAAEPDAPLNIRGNCTGLQALSTDGVALIVTQACKWSGLDKELPSPLSPHDFRHTAATEDARRGWNEPMMRQKYGWGTGSQMPAYYTHLTLDDQRDRLIADAARTAEAARAAATTPQATAAVETLVKLLQQVVGFGQGAAPAPLVTVGGPGSGAAPALVAA